MEDRTSDPALLNDDPMNFENIFDRRKDNSIKWNRYPEDVLPLWVADMDFEAAKPIQQALENFIKTGIYGYAAPPEELIQVIIKRFRERYDWEVKEEWIVWTPSVVSGIYVSAKVASSGKPGAVMTSTPVYHPFLDAAKAEGRKLQAVPLKLQNNRWEMDFEAMENAATDDTRLYILCNPHNPTGRMYNEEELRRLSDFCVKRGILLCSDEIHADLILDDSKRHIPVASLSEEAAMNTISLFSPGKAFNIPGLNAGFAIIPNAELRNSFELEKRNIVPYMTKLAGDAALAAYRDADNWLKEVLVYLKKNHDFLYEELNSIPGLKMLKVEATYLAWVDYSALGISNFAEILEEYGLGVMEATVFMGKGHIRINFATQKHLLVEAVERLKRAVEAVRNTV